MNARCLLLAPAAFAASPALACGGAHDLPGTTELLVLRIALWTSPLLAALLVDRGAFALAAAVTRMERRHRPSLLPPLLALLAVVSAGIAVSTGAFDVAIVAFALVPVATLLCAASFVRSVAIDMRGAAWPRLLRVGAVAVFVAVALARTVL